MQRFSRRSAAVAAAALVASVQFVRPAAHAPAGPFASLRTAPQLSAAASLNAFGKSRAVQLLFALPGGAVEFPLQVSGDVSALQYQWVANTDVSDSTPARPITDSAFVAPTRPGFYHLAVVHGSERQVLVEPTLAVMVPFQQKVGTKLNGYSIGTYVADRVAHHDHPIGFLEVMPSDVGLRVSTHLTLGDFVTRDQPNVWPKYVALNPRLLDKLELVLTKVGAAAEFARHDAEAEDVALDVHSGFRTPEHNKHVRRSARDSRHQYGDAADVAIDADGDGRVTLRDEVLVARAVDQVETEHPDLVGGLGLYTSRRYRTPYVHIDTRGKRSRWTG
jgi:uncharacterized protein YcbK (DUF882 family)